MQIKRFEAADMTEALRMVKRDFGDDAVILSAKEIRPGGFFSALRKKSVEITAATDYPEDDTAGRGDFSGMLSKHLDTETETDRVSLSRTFQAITPDAMKTRSFDHRSPEPDRIGLRSERSGTMPERTLILDETVPARKTDFDPGADEVSTAESSRHTENQKLVAEPFYREASVPKTIALVGPSGAGKSTTLAKLAWRIHKVENKRVGFVSLDRFRVGANTLLSRVAGIMNRPFTIVHDAEQLNSELKRMVEVDVILIDTPGINRVDTLMREDVCTLLRLANPDETHLVANATVRDEVFESVVDTFSDMGVNRLLFTHVDECIDKKSILRLLNKSSLPASFYADGVDLFDGLQEISIEWLGELLSSRFKPSGGQVTAISEKRKWKKNHFISSGPNKASFSYVANRNSELFHHPDCKSVKRINAENITAFNSIEQAMTEGFKPCRACCSDSIHEKPVTGAFGYQRARAI